MKPSQHARFNQGLQPGKTYEIEVFEVTANRHDYRPSTHPYKITFNPSTNFSEVDADIPNYSFRFMEISAITAMPENQNVKYLIGMPIRHLLL